MSIYAPWSYVGGEGDGIGSLVDHTRNPADPGSVQALQESYLQLCDAAVDGSRGISVEKAIANLRLSNISLTLFAVSVQVARQIRAGGMVFHN
jgi:hypothetical protein